MQRDIPNVLLLTGPQAQRIATRSRSGFLGNMIVEQDGEGVVLTYAKLDGSLVIDRVDANGVVTTTS